MQNKYVHSVAIPPTLKIGEANRERVWGSLKRDQFKFNQKISALYDKDEKYICVPNTKRNKIYSIDGLKIVHVRKRCKSFEKTDRGSLNKDRAIRKYEIETRGPPVYQYFEAMKT